jgi:Sel1 repeat
MKRPTLRSRALTLLALGVAWGLAPAVGWCAQPGEELAGVRAAAERGDAAAQTRLGVRYLTGNGVATDATEAVRWYRKAADQGYAPAENELGLCYVAGKGVEKDAAQAVRWYRLAAEQGLAAAQSNLANHYRDGSGVAQSLEEAILWFQKAAEQGYAPALNQLGLCCETGHGVQADLVQAYRWTSLAADRGMAAAQARLTALAARLTPGQIALARQLAADTLPALTIDSLAFRPNPAVRGQNGWLEAVYRTHGATGTVHESWSLRREGQAQFPPLEFDITPAAGATTRSIPLPIPAGIAAGEYELVLQAGCRGQTVTRRFSFRIE